MSKSEFKMRYRYSIGWLIFWVIVFFPIAIVLMATGCYMETDSNRYYLQYEGSRKWLAFWTLVFFPVALVLLLVNGCGWVIEEETPLSPQIQIDKD